MNASNSIGFIRLQTPPGLRKSGMPDSVDMPAPVKTTVRDESARSAASREISDIEAFLHITCDLRALRPPPKPRVRIAPGALKSQLTLELLHHIRLNLVPGQRRAQTGVLVIERLQKRQIAGCDGGRPFTCAAAR